MSFNGYLKTLKVTLDKIDDNQVESIISLIMNAFEKGNFVFVIGNGGSAANASHFAQDLAKGTRLTLNQQKRIKALSLTDNLPFFSALSNDDGYEHVFTEQLKTYASNEDLLIAISGSGNSPNIIKAVEWANSNGLVTVGVTGFSGGKLKEINQYSLHVSLDDMCTTESVHSILFHYIILEIQNKIKELT